MDGSVPDGAERPHSSLGVNLAPTGSRKINELVRRPACNLRAGQQSDMERARLWRRNSAAKKRGLYTIVSIAAISSAPA